jgi:NADH:ubiquinone oxidoreductase subunit 4 (subunit M)
MALILLLEAGMIGVFCSFDLFLFYIFWELILIPMYFIIGIWGGERRVYAALKFFIYTLAGSLFMLVAIIWLGLEAQKVTGVFTVSVLRFRSKRRHIFSGRLRFHSRSKSRYSRCIPGCPMRMLRRPQLAPLFLQEYC